MAAKDYKPSQKYYKFVLYLVIIVLINLVGITLFFRADLTSNHLYSLSKASKEVVSSLKEPLTIDVFFSKNLPAPYSNVELYLHDLLNEFEIYSNHNLSYRFYDVTAKEGDLSETEQVNRKLAESFGITPVNVQKIEQDEAKMQRAYMGIALLHGDLVSRIPSVTSTDGLEYKITTGIKNMTAKVSALLKLPRKIKITAVVSPSLAMIAPLVNLRGLDTVRSSVQGAVERLNPKTYGKLECAFDDPAYAPGTPGQQGLLEQFGLQWPEIKAPNGAVIPAGNGVAALVMQFGDKTTQRNLLDRKMAYTPQGIAEQFSIIDSNEMENFISDNVDNLIELNDSIGYLNTNECRLLNPILPKKFEPGMARPPKKETLDNLNMVLTKIYSVKDVNLLDGIPDNIDTLVISGPREKFSDYQLLQIDQFLMKGKSLAIFLDSLNEITVKEQGVPETYYIPINTGLEKLLEFYGLKVKKSYVMDENCYVNKEQTGEQTSIYYVPMIKNENINHKLPFIENIKQLVMIKASPVEALQEKIKRNNLTLNPLFTSSDKSWEMKGRISLMPYMLKPPTNPKEKFAQPLAYLLEGHFSSYFAGKPVPDKPAVTTEESTGVTKEDTKATAESAQKGSVIKGKKEILTRAVKPGKIFLIGTTEILKNNVIDEEANSPNALFVLNAFDYLNNREDIAVMRSKNQKFNPIEDTKPFTKMAIKIFNIGGLPALFIALGIVLWIRRVRRKRKIQLMFSQQK
ncbi:MAG: Gldg family protein [Candidatus Omnitrophota bacterium]